MKMWHPKYAALAAAVVAVPFADVALADNDRTPPPGQEKKAEHAAPQSAAPENGKGYGAGRSEKPATPDRPARPAPKKARPARPARPSTPARPAGPSTPAGDAGPRAKAGKTAICHATGSATNPYVKITVSDNALRAHARHQDGRDLIPAPAEGCPGEAGGPAPASAPESATKDPAKVTICHATGSATNPYVKITVAEPAVEAHRRHQHGEDIVPAPEGDCPGAAPARHRAPAQPRSALPTALPFPAPAGAAAPLVATVAPRGSVLGAFASSGPASLDQPGTAVAPAGVAAETARRETGAGTGIAASLPFTGLDTWLLVVAGLGLLLAGFAARRAAAQR